MRRVVVTLAALVLALVSSAGARADIVDRLDQTAAEITASKWWNGIAPKMENLRGKVVVLHVSDPARATSQAFQASLAKLAEAYKNAPVVFYEVIEAETESVANDYVVKSGDTIKWQVGFDGVGALQRGYPGSSVPRTYVIGPDGKVAWHAHIGALTKQVLDAQVTRCSFWDVKSVPERARPAAKAMFELRCGDAVVAANKVFADRTAPDDAKAFCARVKQEISRYYTFQKDLVDALVKNLDWSAAYHRVERMMGIYKGTDQEPEVQRRWDELNANPRVKLIVEAQKKLDDLVKDIPRTFGRELEKTITKLKAFQELYPETVVAQRAGDWIADCERRLKMAAGK